MPDLLRRLVMKRRWLIVDKILQVDIQRLGNLIQSLYINGDGTIFIFGQRCFALVDNCRKLFDGVTAALSILFDSMTDEIRK